VSEKHPEFIYGFNAGIQSAWEVVNKMIGTLPVEPLTGSVRTMRDTALDISDNILELKYRAPGEEVKK
jgi:hypothetical protein